MARRGFGGTALRAALGAVTGVAEGLQQRELLAAQQEKERLAAERQRRLDEATLRSEERQAIAAGMIPSERFAAMTMPGATPMKPAISQKIGSREFVYSPDIATAEKHRGDVMKKREEIGKKREERSAIATALGSVSMGGKPVFSKEEAESYAALPSSERSALFSARLRAAMPKREGKGEPSTADKETIGRQFIAAQSRNPALTAALQTAFADNPALARTPGLAAYRIMEEGIVPKLGAGQGFVQKAPKEDEEDELADLLREIEGDETPATAAALPAAAPARPTATAPSAPAARTAAPAAKAGPSADSELAYQRKLWDDAVAKHGREKVIAEFGPRP